MGDTYLFILSNRLELQNGQQELEFNDEFGIVDEQQ